jgi:spermidine synthase
VSPSPSGWTTTEVVPGRPAHEMAKDSRKAKGGRSMPLSPLPPPPASERSRVPLFALLLTLSGFSALVYQMVWLRELRLVFGASTPATAAVLAVFMGGLGFGSVWFGRRAEVTDDPLRFYARLELGVTAAALASPFLLAAATLAYHATGGSAALGVPGASAVRILLAVVVLGPACTLMGGTLPMAARTIERDNDPRRGSIGLLYGLNALGGLIGVVGSTFALLEMLGSRGTLLVAVAVNALVALLAGRASRRSLPSSAPAAAAAVVASQAAAPAAYVYGAACTTGFVFFLSELVWYRMTAPLLGSTVYGFGIILALALAGIGSGGVLYRALVAPRPGAGTASLFAVVSALQALALAAPYAAGDRIALLSYSANALRGEGFAQLVAGWSALAALLVFLPSLLAGVQFPVLVSLLGRGPDRVGEQTGRALGWNTAGSIAGSLLGGFVLIPGLGAPGCWRLATGLTAALAASAIVVSLRRPPTRSLAAAALLASAALVLSATSLGPTGAWRHHPWGYGRAQEPPAQTNARRDWLNLLRWSVRREFDGRESSIAVSGANDTSFLVNGKSDGAALGDDATQVMLPLVSAVLHPSPKRALVVGLGTGSSAGWLAEVPGMEAVDVPEIEPGILDLARREFVPVNRGVMDKPNVRVVPDDAREFLSVRGPSYDLIVSEPSNPYRAGIASLYTQEYYEAARKRLAPGGIFSQWLQGYEVDARSVHEVYATLSSVFPWVETWVTLPGDLLFLAYTTEPSYTMEQVRSRLATEPFREAARRVWFTDSPEGFFARHLGSPELARSIAADHPTVNTDDRNSLEYGFARAATHRGENLVVSDLLNAAFRAGIDRPAHLRSELDPVKISLERMLLLVAEGRQVAPPKDLQGAAAVRAFAIASYSRGDYTNAAAVWPGEPDSVMERLILLQSNAEAGSPREAWRWIAWARKDWPTEANFAAAMLATREGGEARAVEELVQGFRRYRSDPWVRRPLASKALALTSSLARTLPEKDCEALFDALAEPFVMHAVEQERLITRVQVSRRLAPAVRVAVADAWGPWPPWSRPYLEFRRDAYAEAGDPRLASAQADLDLFLREAGAAPAN